MTEAFHVIFIHVWNIQFQMLLNLYFKTTVVHIVFGDNIIEALLRGYPCSQNTPK